MRQRPVGTKCPAVLLCARPCGIDPCFNGLFPFAGQAAGGFDHRAVVPVTGRHVAGHIHDHIRRTVPVRAASQGLVDPLNGLAAFDRLIGCKDLSITAADPAPIVGPDNQVLCPVALNICKGVILASNVVCGIKPVTNHRELSPGDVLAGAEGAIRVSVENPGPDQRGNGGVGPALRAHVGKAVLVRQTAGSDLFRHQAVKNHGGLFPADVVFRSDCPVLIPEDVRCVVRHDRFGQQRRLFLDHRDLTVLPADVRPAG